MNITLTCHCGTMLCADEDEIGTMIDCPVCGHQTRVPSAKAPAGSRPPPIEDVLLVEPGAEEEEEIPEMEVEEHVAEWDKKKRRAEKEQRDRQEDEEAEAKEKSSNFAN